MQADPAAPGNLPPLDYARLGAPWHRGWLTGRFSRWHLWVALALWLAFSGLTLFIVLKALDRAAEKPGTVAATTAATVLGPMTGAVSRDFQGCCAKFSLSLLPYCLGALLTGIAVQLFVVPRGWVTKTVRVLSWCAGWFVYFGGGIVSFGHALS